MSSPRLKAQINKEQANQNLYELGNVLGYQHAVKDSISFCGHDTIFYLSGHRGVFHNLKRNSQLFISLRQEDEITAMSFGLNSSIVIAAKPITSKPYVYVFNIKNHERKILQMADIKSESFVCVAFTNDNERVAAQGSSPDWAFVIWNWEKKLTEMVFRPFRMEFVAEIYRFAFCPEDHKYIALVGHAFLRFYRRKGEQKILETAIHEREHSKQSFHSVAWLQNSFKVLIGTSGGEILVFEKDCLQRQISILKELSRIERSIDHTDQNISCLLTTSEGIICSYGTRSVLYFKNNFEIDRKFDVQDSSTESRIIQVNLNREMNYIVAATKDGRIFSCRFADSVKAKSHEDSFSLVQDYQHTDDVICADTAPLISIQATCSSTFIILRDLTIGKVFLREKLYSIPVSVSLHPLGTGIVIGFHESAKFYAIVLDKLVEEMLFKEARNSQVSFSPSGHLIAITSGHVIEIYFSIGFRELIFFKKHHTDVQHILWRDDNNLLSADDKGTLYEWDVAGKKAAWKLEVPGGCVTSWAIADKNNDILLYVACSDCKMRQIKERKWLHNSLSTKGKVTAMVVTKAVVFCGTEKGSILGFHSSLRSILFECECHLGNIIHLGMLNNSTTVVAVGVDGMISTWNPQYWMADEQLPVRNEVLVETEKQKAFVQNITKLEKDLDFRTHQAEDASCRVKSFYQERLTEINEKSKSIQGSLKDTINNLEEELHDIIRSSENAIANQEAIIETERKENEINFQRKMEKENDFMKIAISEREDMMRNFTLKMSQKEEEKQASMENFRIKYAQYQARLKGLEEDLKEEETARRKLDEEREVFDQEIENEKKIHLQNGNSYLDSLEQKEQHLLSSDLDELKLELNYEKECCKSLEEEYKKKNDIFQQLQKISEQIKSQVTQAQNDVSRLDKVQATETDMSTSLEKEAGELTIEGEDTLRKYEQILEMKKEDLVDAKNELQKIKAVHKDLVIQLNKRKREEAVLNERLLSTEKGVSENTGKLQASELRLERYHSEFLSATENCPSKNALRWALLRLYENRAVKTPIKEENIFVGDTDPYTRFCRQRDNYENLINVVQNRTTLIKETFKENYIKLAKENSDWRAFVEALRDDIRQKRERIRTLEELLGLKSNDFSSNLAETRRRLWLVAASLRNMDMQEDSEIEKKLSLIDEKEKEIRRLHGLLSVGERGKIVRKMPY